MKKILLSCCIILSTLSIAAIDTRVSADEENVVIDNIEQMKEEKSSTLEKTSDGHLADYSEMYGREPIQYNKKNFGTRKGRSATPIQLSYLAVFVEFPDLIDVDLDHENTVKVAKMVLNDGGTALSYGTTTKPIQSLKQYIKKYSYNSMDVTGSVYPQNDSGEVVSYVASQPRGYYMPYHATNNTIGYTDVSQELSREKQLISGALAAAKSSIEKNVNAQQLDADNDGCIDAISFFVEAPKLGEDGVEWADLLWSHKTSISTSITINGKRLNDYNLINTNDPTTPGSPFSYLIEEGEVLANRVNYGVIHHEYLHTLSLPDLYRGTTEGRPVAFYDVMAETNNGNPQGLLGITKEWLEWTPPMETVTTSQRVTIQKPNYISKNEKYGVKIKSPVNTNEYIVAEFYEKQIGELSNVTGRENGLLLYRIKQGYYTNIGASIDGSEDFVFVYRPGETTLGRAKGDLYNAVVSPTPTTSYGKTYATSSGAWDPTTLYYTDGKNSGIKVDIVSSTADSITFDVTVPTATDISNEITSITLNETNVSMQRGQSKLLQTSIIPQTATNKTLSWKSSNDIIATVDSNGMVVAHAVGKAVISVKTSNGLIASCEVIVEAPSLTVQYKTHVEDVGWQGLVSNGGVSGTSGQSKRLEAITVNVLNPDYAGGIQYQTHVQDVGWQDWKVDGNISGTSGQSKRLEAIRIKLTGELANNYDVYYQVHAQDTGWMGWAKNGDSSGTAGYGYRLEAIKIMLVTKGGSAPGSTAMPYKQRYLSYQTHVENVGWQGAVYDGSISGTSGESKRLEAINLALVSAPYSGAIQYSTHIQDIGWQDWRQNGQMSGTSGQSKRLEAIKIKLTGEMARQYDVYYRVHAQEFGWMGWTKNGQPAGTTGYGYRLEAIQVVLVNKGDSTYGSTSNYFRKS